MARRPIGDRVSHVAIKRQLGSAEDARRPHRRRCSMPFIESTVGELPYKLVDFDQHSYESDDCFTRHMPKAKLDSAIYPIRNASGRKVLLAGNRIVNALEGDLDMVNVPGSLVEMLK